MGGFRVSKTFLNLSPKTKKIPYGHKYTQTKETVIVYVPSSSYYPLYFTVSNKRVAYAKWGESKNTASKLTVYGVGNGKATITITSTEEGVNVSRSIQVIQDGLSFIELEVSPKQLEFSCIGGEPQVITIEKSNAQWWTTLIPIEPEEEEVSWLKLNKTNDIGTSTIQVTCTDNTTLLQRRATIVFSSGNKNGGVPQRVNIMQAAATLPVISDFSLRSKGDIMETAMFSFAFESAFPVTEYGLCYSIENKLPTTDDEHVSQNADAKSMTGITMETGTLQPRKTYYVRAYAKSVVGVNYSTNVLAIETLGDAPGKGDNPPLFVPKR